MTQYTRNITTACTVALFVGTVLNAINNYEVIAEQTIRIRDVVKIFLTYLTPFCVSLYSSVKAQKQIVADK